MKNNPISEFNFINKWDERFLNLSEHFSTWSKDPSTKVGAVAISQDKQILSMGWNGFPRGIFDTEERLNDRKIKYDFVVHAEKNLIYNACMNGISLKNSTLYVNFPVCGECAKAIVQVGIKKIVCGHTGFSPRWKESNELAEKVLNEANVEFIYYIKEKNTWRQN